MSQLTTVCFDGDTLQAVNEQGRVWVVVKRVCEALGVTEERQARKLKEKAWACTALMAAHDTSGREQQLFCLDLDSLPMWLANIEPRRVAEHVRPKLIRYQCECAKVLRDHFFGRRQAESARSVDPELLAQLMTLILEQGRRFEEYFRRTDERFREFESRGTGYITGQQLRQLKSHVRRVASLHADCGLWKTRQAATTALHQALRAGCGWGGTGCPLDQMPAAQFPMAIAILNSRQADAERMLEALAAQRQTHFCDFERKH